MDLITNSYGILRKMHHGMCACSINDFVDASLREIFHSLSAFFTHFSKCIRAPTAAMVDSRCSVLLQAQFTGEEESDELED